MRRQQQSLVRIPLIGGQLQDLFDLAGNSRRQFAIGISGRQGEPTKYVTATMNLAEQHGELAAWL